MHFVLKEESEASLICSWFEGKTKTNNDKLKLISAFAEDIYLENKSTEVSLNYILGSCDKQILQLN